MLTTRDEDLRKGQRRIESMIDWLVSMHLAHTPKVPDERRPAAAAVQRRYRNWREALADSVGEFESRDVET